MNKYSKCFLIIILISTCIVSAVENQVTKDEVLTSINEMIFSKDYKCKILKISESINNICAVAISPPYREFPNIILFKKSTNGWQTVFEGLCVGIQAEPSGKEDLHVLKMGADVLYDNGPLVFHENRTKKAMIDNIEKGVVIIPYQDFTHLHSSSDIKKTYTIDKTNFRTYAIKLLGPENYPISRKECILYDIPEIQDMVFKYKKGEYVINCLTDNNQKWEISFSGVDSDNMFLLNKVIEVDK